MKNADQKAYPQPNPDLTSSPEYGGLSKRERFAMAAMQALLTGTDSRKTMYAISENANAMKRETAKMSVKYADALLAELENTEDL